LPDTSARLGGSAKTILYFGGPDGNVQIAYTESYTETPPELVAQHQFIHPLDWQVPPEIMVAQAMNGGLIELELIENWSEQVWNRFGGALRKLAGTVRGGGANASDTILDIVRAISIADGPMFITKIIDTPHSSTERLGGSNPHRRATFYMNVKIVRVADGDQNLRRDTMQVTKRVTCAYTHRLYHRMPAQRRQPVPAGFPNNIPQSGLARVTGAPVIGNRI
jgi:hypothetical protein